MKCSLCGSPDTHNGREVHLYRECGLPNVVLVGVEIRRCRNCGEYAVKIPNILGLHRVIATTLSGKASRMTGDEVKFLRKYLGYTGVDFGRQMNVTAETVSRWETGHGPIGVLADRLLRSMVLSQQPVTSYPARTAPPIDRTNQPDSQPVRITMDANGEWKVADGNPSQGRIQR